jgi:predicted acylesterase/phospholipase RssA
VNGFLSSIFGRHAHRRQAACATVARAAIELPLRIAFGLLLALWLSACATQRPVAATCPPAAEASPTFDAAVDSVVTERWRDTVATPHHRVAILVLSGGGAWGAYGAGFLEGWSHRRAGPDDRWPGRPEFDVVTGISTGAIMAPFALVGSERDASLRTSFRGVSGDDLYSGSGLLGLLWGHSLKKPDGIERRLVAALDDETLAAMSKAAAEHRTVWVAAVNFDTGRFTEFDLSAMASSLPPDRARAQIVDRIMAASALPGLFPPRYIDGCMYMDGGVRRNVFVGPLQRTADPAGEQPSRADIYVIENGPVGTMPRLTGAGVRAIATRGYELTENQVELDSLRTIEAYARARGYGFYWTSADDVVHDPGDANPQGARCAAPKTPADQFDAVFTACLYDAGLAKARDGAAPWRTDRP